MEEITCFSPLNFVVFFKSIISSILAVLVAMIIAVMPIAILILLTSKKIIAFVWLFNILYVLLLALVYGYVSRRLWGWK